ncbi:MAG: membrane protein insertion efficiency factor YidD [bacterium]
MSSVAIVLIKLYQALISPILQGSCRHFPSCSNYGIEAFRIHGFFYGFYLTSKRILKCNPFFEGGYDPVPQNKCVHKTETLKLHTENN